MLLSDTHRGLLAPTWITSFSIIQMHHPASVVLNLAVQLNHRDAESEMLPVRLAKLQSEPFSVGLRNQVSFSGDESRE